ncbi:DUF7503 family protein [Halapricum desulfuricans]
MSQSASSVRNFVEEHPKWIGVLFWMAVLLTQAGTAVGGHASSTVGP